MLIRLNDENMLEISQTDPTCQNIRGADHREKFKLFRLSWVHLYSDKLNTTLGSQMTGTDTEYLRPLTRTADQGGDGSSWRSQRVTDRTVN